MGQEQLIGTWKLVAHETRRTTGEVTYPLGRDFVGLLIYDTHRYCSVQIMRRDRLPFRSEDLQHGTSEEIKAAFEGYFAYFGTYEVNAEAGTVTHYVECALFPNWVGTKLTRVFEFTGSRLMLKSSPYVVAGEQLVGVAIWERVVSGENRS